MLTPHLEQLILSGKASFNTYMCGGSQKNVLTVANDRYIIITSLLYQSPANSEQINMTNAQFLTYQKSAMLTQCKIFSEKSVNNFVFRDQVSVVHDDSNNRYYVMPCGNTKIDTYLIHESDVSFTFSKGSDLTNSVTSITRAQSVGQPLPFDYGKQGQNAEPVKQLSEVALSPGNYIAHGGQYALTNNRFEPTEMVFPINSTLNYQDLTSTKNTPLLIVQYVEIFGNLTNISATL